MAFGPQPTRTGAYHLLAVSGSLRAASSHTLLLQAAAALVPPDVQVVFYRGLGGLPQFNPDHDAEPYPPPVQEWRAAIAWADALLISSPEYAHGVPGTLKNGLDWLVSGAEFPAILIALLSPSPRATHAQAALAETLQTMAGALVADASVVLPMAGRQLTLSAVLGDPALAGPLRHGMEALSQALRRAREENRRLAGPQSAPAAI